MNEHDMVEDTEQEEVSELDYPPEGELSSLMLMGFPSDRIYMVYDCGEVYYFRYLGNETFGIDTELLLAQTPDADHIEVAKKDKLYRKQDISSCRLSRKLSASTQLENCGSFHFTYEGKVQRFIVLEKPAEQQVMDFLSDVSAVYPPKSDKELAKEQQESQNTEREQALSAEQNPETLRKCKIIGGICTVLGALLMIGTFVICDPYDVWVGACFVFALICFLLCVCKPLYFTPWFTTSENSGLSMVSMQIAFGSPVIALCFRALFDVNYLSYTKLIVFSAIFGIILSIIFLIRDRTKTNNVRIAAVIYCLIFAFGSVGEANYLLDSCEPYEKYVCNVTHKYDESENDYTITVDAHGKELDLAVSEEDFQSLSVGDRIPVYFYSGGLGIPFVDTIKY
ncbi:hypothetical protein [Butyricicoccus intestinisimiae]|uniref:DUF4178 domain-containing protein n=1 Tax=Butyricicoccus intestinisimiae TaxID=2841509 RepID=A0ABS6EQX8_9FIRM|nr:hypothetical protein [Butyricicoccus intestinisimiae]MBU5490099.1 hypothetical protein [Butyricicoccus intestinisimiae]